MQNSKRSEEFGLELAIPFGLDVFIIQPNYIAWGVAPRLHAFVVSLLLKLLGVMEGFPTHCHQHSKLGR